MKITPLAFESFGTRSMSTFVQTKDANVLIDPGVALAPLRYGLSPHPVELKRLNEHWNKIVKYAKSADIFIITHYHYDHYNPNDNLEIYKNKIVLIKHPAEKINLSQKKRVNYFLEKIKNLPEKLKYSDGKEFKFGDTKIKFSPPVFHGTNSKLGYVTEVLVDDGYKFIYTSDVEGPALEDQVNFILKEKPNLIIVDGPLSYMLGYRYSYLSLSSSVENLIKIVSTYPLDSLIVEHHLLRELKWKEKIAGVFEVAEKKNIKIQTAAEFADIPVEMLEARRKELYQKYPE